MSTTDNPCQHCGACCATFRVSFYWAEPETAGLPAGYSEQLNAHLACMRGTSSSQPRCAALSGEIGGTVGCTVYPHRPSVCRQVQIGDDHCIRARAHHGLDPL